MKRSTEWPICLLEYLMTPIRHQGVDSSPLKLMQRRTIRGRLPVKQQESNLDDYVRYHARKQEQAKYQTGKPLQELPEGSNILFYSERESQWLPGVIVQRLHDRSYVIISEKGRKVVRHRIDIQLYHKDVHVRFQSTYKRAITPPMTSSSYPLTVKQPVQPNTSHTSPLDPSGSSGPNNSNHQKPPLSSQKSSVQSSLPSSKINSSSSSSSQKPIPASSPKRISTGTSHGLKAGASGKIKPIQAKKTTVSSHNLTSNGMTSPPQMRSGRTVHLPGRYRD